MTPYLLDSRQHIIQHVSGMNLQCMNAPLSKLFEHTMKIHHPHSGRKLIIELLTHVTQMGFESRSLRPPSSKACLYSR